MTDAHEERAIRILLRLIENRLCADCDQPLGETSVSALCLFGAWICEKCANVHGQLRLCNPKSLLDVWSEEEVQAMQRAKNNKKVNELYERFIPEGWRKCRPDAAFDDRLLWIRAKYENKMFILPQNKRRANSLVESTKRVPSSLPVRIVDFFLVISPGVCHQYQENLHDLSPDDISFDTSISSCFPGLDFYSDMLLPDHVGPFVFPAGVHLTQYNKSPFFFTFVLTDFSGTKMYGAILQFYELVEPHELAAMIGHPVGSSQFPKWPLVFSPKALTILSHYPFYNLFREYLEQLYRISLSSSPIPLERYIVNFVQEVPLPPQGQIEVNFALADRTVRISRPPKNRLPMVDFSYRPLFTCLSVDNILYIFSALCTERKVCFYSNNIALLTPVQEALLSLLFPLVWQGAYIPIIPDNMGDILDAPVPILVGMRCDHALTMEELNQHPGLLFVDLDHDTVVLANDDIGRPSIPCPPIPQKPGEKLRNKLQEFGACIFNKKETSSGTKKGTFSLAGDAFPRGEHLIPIKVFAFEQGVTIERKKSVTISRERKEHNKLNKSSNKSYSSNHPIVSSKSSVNSDSILDPNNNADWPYDKFDAKEIRGAFLRFFVSVLKDIKIYKSNLGDVNDSASIKSGSTMSSRAFERRSSAEKTIFINLLQETQMFERLSEERAERPDQPEIKFFDESILEKLNRSKLNRHHHSVPFLEDTSDEVDEIHNSLPPSNWGIPVDQRYSYLKFPFLKQELYGPIRRARPLLRTVELQRQRAALADEVVEVFKWKKNRKTGGVDVVDSAGGLEEILTESKLQFHRFNKALCSLQSKVRMIKFRLPYIRMRRAIIRIQRPWRAYRLRKLNALYNAREKALVCKIQKNVRRYIARKRYVVSKQSILKLQSYIRMFLNKCRLNKSIRSIIKIQALYRCWCHYSKYSRIKSCVARIKGLIKGWLTRRKILKLRLKRLSEYRSQMFELWKLDNTPLIYRSKFWRYINGTGFLFLGLHEDELRRLWKAQAIKLPQGVNFLTQFDVVALHMKQPDKNNAISGLRVEAINREIKERKDAYLKLKKQFIKEKKEESYKQFFITGKLKKRRLTEELLWKKIELADASCNLILEGLSNEECDEWIYGKTESRIRTSSVQTVRACLLSIQRLNNNQSQYNEKYFYQSEIFK